MGLSLLQKVTPVKMKVLFIAATIALASAGFAPSCEECNTASAVLLERMTSAESIAEQTGILISQVCPQADDAAACEAGLATLVGHGHVPLPRFHWVRRCLRASWPLQEEEPAWRVDLRRLHRCDDPRCRFHEGADNH